VETLLILNEALKKRFGNSFILLVGVQEGIGDMVELVKQGTRIENPREYELGAVEHLRHLLEIGSPAQRDPQRENFYQIESNHENYYIHVSPISGNVVLLAKWLRQPQDCCLSLGHLVA
jgi:hypothetical protein